MATTDPTLRRLLTTPYVALVEAVEDDGGTWRRRASYPEIEGYSVVADTAWDAFDQLEEGLAAAVLAAVDAGRPPRLPVDRKVMPDLDAAQLLRRAGLESRIDQLDEPVAGAGTSGGNG